MPLLCVCLSLTGEVQRDALPRRPRAPYAAALCLSVYLLITGGVRRGTVCLSVCLSQERSGETREVHHFQFTAWPDHGVPEHPTPLLLFMRRVKFMTAPDHTGRLIVHCRYTTRRTNTGVNLPADLSSNVNKSSNGITDKNNNNNTHTPV